MKWAFVCFSWMMAMPTTTTTTDERDNSVIDVGTESWGKKCFWKWNAHQWILNTAAFQMENLSRCIFLRKLLARLLYQKFQTESMSSMQLALYMDARRHSHSSLSVEIININFNSNNSSEFIISKWLTDV